MTGIVRLAPRSQRGFRTDGFLRRRTGLIVPLILVAFAAFLFFGIATMEVPAGIEFPGPKVFPTIVAVGCAAVAAFFAVDVLRHPEPADTAPRSETTLGAVAASGLGEDESESQSDLAEDEPVRTRSNYRALAAAAGVLIVFTAALTPVGWLISGAFLFWGVAWALGSRRHYFDIVVAIAVSSIVQLAFSAGLGLALPPGILAGVL